ncbi:14822ea5-0490-4dac-a6c0-22cd1d76eaed [Thermothielavioides terrestris]|uniref:14822ea5-0490-4dac-a6c0-22cd1d76eaed n=1 Tax=Thermothielavioides terrestris TaxID=2587410 RepID=A0A446BDA0_9PEZI|nr:14822ea5-0490-4dac-a6c0-22cd1d76eaed [Thermothielavioides terrestris]
MPPNRALRPGSQATNKSAKHIEAAVEFATNLKTLLSAPDPSDTPLTDDLVADIARHAARLHACQQTYVPGLSGDPEIDELATALWNVCTRLGRAHKEKAEREREKTEAGGGQAGREGEEEKAGGKNAGEAALASPVLQVVADYKGWLQDVVERIPEEEVKECRCLEVEYFIMRTALSWVEDRLDVAEHMYTKADRLRQFLTPEYAERLADVLYEIGKSLSARNDFAIAIKWFERANQVVNDQELEQLSREGLELRLAIQQALVTALLGTGTPEDHEKAKNMVDYIESEAGNKFVVSLLKLELLQKTPAEVFDGEAYADILRRLIRDFSFSDSGFKLIMHHIRKLHDKSPGAGCAVLDDFISAIGGAEQDGWMEKAVITRMWMITNQRDSVETINAVQGVLGHLARPLSAEAAVAAQALLWKKLESNYSQSQKLLLCALARNSLDAAASIIHKMSPQSWQEPMTAYLAFKVAIRLEDRAMAEKCLDTVAQASDHIDYLGACIAESQKTGDVACAIAALRKLHQKYEYREPNPIHLPALFRCTIRLLNLLADRPGVDTNGIVGDLCEEFDAVVLALDRQKEEPTSGRKLFTVDELEWFSRNAYNLALKNSATWDLRCVVRMLTACVRIIGHFPSDLGSKVDLSLKTLFSNFVISSALVALARTQDNVEKQLQDYGTMRKHISDFDNQLPEYLPHLDEQSKEDMFRKHATLLAFDFEAAIALKQWEDLGSIVQRAVPCKNITAFQAMADSLLRAQAPGQVLYSTMRKIVNEIWVLESFDAVKLAKYTRCLFQATLPLDDGLAMRLLDEACSKARELRESDATWPEEELEWMATTAFNHAIDCYGAHEVERARDWATKAINLAHYCNDGRLEEILQSKYLRLSLDGGPSG